MEIVEFGVLAIARGIDARRFAIGGAADDLRFLLSFGADRDRLLLPRGAHPVIRRLKRRTLGQVGALDPDVDDLGAIFLRLAIRSEEHTSELQSLMRISYAVFCLTK